MRNRITVRCALFVALFVAPQYISAGLPGPADSTGQYVGAEACLRCHASAYEIWLHSAHARASLMLGMAVGKDMTRRAGERQASTGEQFACRTCHAPPGEKFAAWTGPGYHPEDGVQCETCHGPSGEHVRIEAAKDTLNGHRVFMPKKNRDLCQACHYEEKPFHTRAALGTPAFNYDKWWPLIAHPTPDAERARR